MLTAIRGFIKANIIRTDTHAEQIKQAVKHGNGAIVRIDADTYATAKRTDGIYNIVYMHKGKVQDENITIDYSYFEDCMEDIAELSEWRAIK